MNSLSWLLIAINWIGNAKVFFLVALGLSIAFMLVWIFFAHVSAAAHNEYYTNKISHKDRFDLYKKYVWIPIVFGLFNVFIPDNRTMYLVAASEIGEKVATSERVAGLVDPTIDILKNYITLENEKIAKELSEFRNKSEKK